MIDKYTLDDLMRVTGKCEVSVRGKRKVFHLRTLSHREHHARQNHAAAAARHLYRCLKVPTSPEYAEFLAELDEVERAEVEEIVLTLNRGVVLARAAEREIHANDSPEPEADATLVDMLEIEEETERIEAEVVEEKRNWISEAAEAYGAEVKAMPDDELLALAKKLRTDVVTNVAYNDAFSDVSLYYGVFRDPKREVRYFTAVNAVSECDPELRSALIAGYNELDRFVLEAGELKN